MPSPLMLARFISPACGERSACEATSRSRPGEGAIHELHSPREPLTQPSPREERGEGEEDQPATSLILAISSSTALSTGTFSLTTRFMASAHTFSLLRLVNL